VCHLGYANLFQQAGLFTEDQSSFKSISTVSGGSWFSTQLFYSAEFYNRTALAPNPQAVNDFVVEWMNSYYRISTDVSKETIQKCNYTDLYNDDNGRMVETITEFCYLLETFDYDWATFMYAMLEAASEDYGSQGFVDLSASADNIISPLQSTDLEILAAFTPVSRVRYSYGEESTAAFLGSKIMGSKNSDNAKLWTVALPAAWIVDTLANTSKFFTGVSQFVGDEIDPSPDSINLYTASISNDHSWEDWSSFYLYSNGTVAGNHYTNNSSTNAQFQGTLRPLFGGITPTTLQVAAISSAAAASASPLGPVSYTQNLSIGRYMVYVNTVWILWRVLAGIAAGLGVGIVLGVAISQLRYRYDLCKFCNTKKSASNIDDVGAEDAADNVDHKEQDDANDHDVVHDNTNNDAYNNCCCCNCDHPARNWGIGCGVFFGIIAGVVTATFYGLGSIIVPSVYDDSVDQIYKNPHFDNFAVCSQWPNLPCTQEDAYLMDGWFVDNPALPINIGHIQDKIGLNETIKVLLSNCNDVWDSEWNRAQYLAYFETYFNKGIAPGDYSWGPGWFIPSRSQQIFSEYLDPAGLDALLEPIADSNMTTALLQGTTIDNPSYNVRAGQRVEMLLLNANANITTYVIGRTAIETYTQPLADMASNIAASDELLERVKEFVMRN
jgi:hypothetical protein